MEAIQQEMFKPVIKLMDLLEGTDQSMAFKTKEFCIKWIDSTFE